MSRATGLRSSLSSYEDAWEGINRLIRRGGSWSGYESNCFYVNDRKGGFINTSAVSGLDSIQDGRGLAVWDFDRDGDPDLLVKNRNSPQLRIWRNDHDADSAGLGPKNRRITLTLEGRQSNRQAVGARVTLHTGDGVRVKEVRAGSAFLSQSSKTLFFGLGQRQKVPRLEIRWPSGLRQEFAELATDRAYSVREGDRELRTHEFGKAPGSAALPSIAQSAKQRPTPSKRPVPSRRRVWLLDPLPLKELGLAGAKSSFSVSDDHLGTPLLVNLWSPDCAICLEELHKWSGERAAGDPVALVAVAPASNEIRERAVTIAERLKVPYRLAQPRDLLALSIVIEEVVHWPRQLLLPTSLLFDSQGYLVRLYEGAVSWKEIVEDAAKIPEDERTRLRLGLPYPGTFYGADTFRNEFQLGLSFLEAGYQEYAIATLERSLRRRPDQVEAIYNIGVIWLENDQLEKAETAFEKALQMSPDFVDARVNLGVILARQGRVGDAERLFGSSLQQRPDHIQAHMNLGNLALARGDARDALKHFRHAVEVEPNLSEAHKSLGTVCGRLGDLAGARAAFETVTRLDPQDAKAWSNLGAILAEMGQLEKGLQACLRAIKIEPEEASAHNNAGLIYGALGQDAAAIRSFERAIDSNPQLESPHLNLARILLRRGDAATARKTLKAFLERFPGHPEAERLWQRSSAEN